MFVPPPSVPNGFNMFPPAPPPTLPAEPAPEPPPVEPPPSNFVDLITANLAKPPAIATPAAI